VLVLKVFFGFEVVVALTQAVTKRREAHFAFANNNVIEHELPVFVDQRKKRASTNRNHLG
jgi:hypothetical protein